MNVKSVVDFEMAILIEKLKADADLLKFVKEFVDEYDLLLDYKGFLFQRIKGKGFMAAYIDSENIVNIGWSYYESRFTNFDAKRLAYMRAKKCSNPMNVPTAIKADLEKFKLRCLRYFKQAKVISWDVQEFVRKGGKPEYVDKNL